MKNTKKHMQFLSWLPHIGTRSSIHLIRHIISNKLIESHQSAYRPYHSTEMALLKVKSDLITTIENQEIACPVLLDLSAVFDTVDNGILLQQLTHLFGITGKCQDLDCNISNWMNPESQSWISESAPITLECGVPQDSVLGPILFILYTTH